MNKDNDHYRSLDLPGLALSVPRDREERGKSEAFQDMLVALALRCRTEQFTAADLLAYLGEPDSIAPFGDGDTWEYSWRGEHCAREYRSSTPFIVKNGHVLGIHRKVLTPAS